MANNIALAKTFVPILDEIYKLASLTSKLDGAAELARQGANANELIVPMLSICISGKSWPGASRNTLQTKISGTLPRSTVLPVLSGLSASWPPKRTGSLRMNAGTF